jgi:pimeloyl-ACP methyl ester carboxylesterase
MAATAQGDRAAAYDAFMGAVCGPDHRAVLAATLGSGGLARAEQDSVFFFTNEMPATGRWTAPDLSRVAARTLLVAGAASPLATHRLVSRLADQLPDARVATIEGANHLLPLTHPSALADLVTSGRIAVAG